MPILLLDMREELEFLIATFRQYKCTGNGTLLIDILNFLNNTFKVYINISHDFYKDGVNVGVNVLTYYSESKEYYKEDLCTGMYGDNGEFSSDVEALIFGIEKAIELLEYKSK